MSESKKVWNDKGGALVLSNPSREFKELENCVYRVSANPAIGFFLYKESESFDFGYKVYGLEDSFIKRVERTFNLVDGNLGVLLNGVKGTGKTVTSKVIANMMNQPVILIETEEPGYMDFVNSIPQNVTVVIDEYEKVFKESASLLTVMDGMANSRYKRLFLLTTNTLRIETNLIDRPSRVRYLKTYGNLSPEIVNEIVDDILINKNFKEETINFIATLELITVDIVKSIINEVNMHNESPEAFKNIFNAKTIQGSFNITMVDKDNNLVKIFNDVDLNYHPKFSKDMIGYHFYVSNETFGIIKSIIDYNTIVIEPIFTDNDTRFYNGVVEDITINVIASPTTNDIYAYDGYGSSQIKKILSSGPTELGSKLITRKFYKKEEVEEISKKKK